MNIRSTIVRPISLTFLMAVPFGFGVGFLFAGIYEGWEEYKREFLEIRSSNKYHNRSLEFLDDGKPIVQDRRWGGGADGPTEYSHLDGSALTQTEDQSSLLYQQQLRMDEHRPQHPFNRGPFDGLLTKTTRWWAFQDPTNRSIRWSWETLAGETTIRLLIARHGTTRNVISYIAPDGFSHKRPTSGTGFIDPSEVEVNGNSVAFRSGADLLSINLVERTITTIAKINREQDAWAMFLQNDDVGWRFAVRTPDSVQVYSVRGVKLFEFPVQKSDFGRPALYTPADGNFIVTEFQGRDKEMLPKGGEVSYYELLATWLDGSGKVIRTLKFKNTYTQEKYRAPSAVVNWIDRTMEAIGPGLVVSEPAVMCGGVYVLVPWISLEMFPERPVSETIDEVLEHIPYGIPVSAIVGLICAIVCWRRQVRYQADWTKTWVVFVFLFGIAGLLAWRVHRRWPPMELVGLHEADFVGPELNGLEIR